MCLSRYKGGGSIFVLTVCWLVLCVLALTILALGAGGRPGTDGDGEQALRPP